jgi:hypothetical protein
MTNEKKSRTVLVKEFLKDRKHLLNRKEVKLMRHYMTFWLSPQGGVRSLPVAFNLAEREISLKRTKAWLISRERAGDV